MPSIADAQTNVSIARAALDRAQRRNQALGRLKPGNAEERMALRDALLASIARVQRAKLRLGMAMRELDYVQEAEARRRDAELLIVEDRRGEPWAMASNPYACAPTELVYLPDLVA